MDIKRDFSICPNDTDETWCLYLSERRRRFCAAAGSALVELEIETFGRVFL